GVVMLLQGLSAEGVIAGSGSDDEPPDELVLVSQQAATEQFLTSSGETVTVSGIQYIYASRAELTDIGTSEPSAAQVAVLSCTISYSNYGTAKYFTSSGTIIGSGARITVSS